MLREYLLILSLCVVTIAVKIQCSEALNQVDHQIDGKVLNKREIDLATDVEDEYHKDDLSGSASYGYGYYGYPFGGAYGGFPYLNSIRGHYGSFYPYYYPYYGGYDGYGGYHGHYF